jgi:hypothetical protein
MHLTPKVGNYGLAAMDQFGHRTAIWGMLRQASPQVRKPTLTRLQFSRVSGSGRPSVPKGCQGLDGSQVVAEARGGDGRWYSSAVSSCGFARCGGLGWLPGVCSQWDKARVSQKKEASARPEHRSLVRQPRTALKPPRSRFQAALTHHRDR